jgi:hypothetical protein
MSTSYSKAQGAYLNVGPLTFIPGFGNSLPPSTDASDLDQNYPLLDYQHEILATMTFDPIVPNETTIPFTYPDNVDGTDYMNMLPQTAFYDASLVNIDVSTNLFVQGLLILQDVSSAIASQNQAATCGYVNLVLSEWAKYPAVQDVDMSDNGITDCSFIEFVNGATLESSGNYLQLVSSSGLTVNPGEDGGEVAWELTHGHGSMISFDACGTLAFYSGYGTTNGTDDWTTNAAPGAYLDSNNLFTASLVFSNAITCDVALKSGETTVFEYTVGPSPNTAFPSVFTLPTLTVVADNLTPSTIDGYTFYAITEILFVGTLPATGFVFYGLIENGSTATQDLVITDDIGSDNYTAHKLLRIAPGSQALVTFHGLSAEANKIWITASGMQQQT